MTATQAIIKALAENAAMTLDKETKAFACFRFRLSGEIQDTVVRVHKATTEFETLSAIAS
jgi:hypothetical protein